MPEDIDPESKVRSLAVTVVAQSSDSERIALLKWAEEMRAIVNRPGSLIKKATSAIQLTAHSKVLLPIMKLAGGELKRLGWDDRGLPARIAIGAAGAALTLSGSGAGIAALGGAIGGRLWVVFGAGGAFVGVIIDELNKPKK
ncbi:hypothetical protein [Massilia sp. TWP1-3-3]|uniref:hypothetical protein n=1 Tax=Massilia sp. TWP1-3-3 TaxID=2804573 RepID=UPI003CF34BA0